MPTYTTVIPADVPAPGDPFVFVVPGNQRWWIRTIFAELDRASGGTGSRAPQVTVTDGTLTVIQSAFIDSAPDPGVLAVTWCHVTTFSIAEFADGTALVPFPEGELPPGYNIIGTIGNAQAGDQWLSARALIEFVDS